MVSAYEARFLPPEDIFPLPSVQPAVEWPESGLDYYPESPDVMELPGSLRFALLLQQLATYHTGRRSYDAKLTLAEEEALFNARKLGLKAKDDLARLRDKAGGTDTAAIKAAEVAAQKPIKAGAAAERALIEVNARLARFAARASLGKQPQRAGVIYQLKKGDLQEAKKRGESVGTYTDIAGLASQYADEEDRTMSGICGLMKAVHRYKDFKTRQAESPGKKLRPTRFGSYAMYDIQGTIARDVDTTDVREQLGVRLQETTRREIAAYHRTHSDLADVSLEQAGSREEFEHIQTLSDLYLSSQHLSIDDLSFPDAASEEAPDGYDADEMPALGLEEVYPDRNETSWVEDEAGRDLLADQLIGVLKAMVRAKALSERDAGIMRMRFGLDDGEYKNQTAVGEVFGLTARGVSQVEKKVLRKLRRPGWLGSLASLQTSAASATMVNDRFSGTRLRTGRMPASEALPMHGPMPAPRSYRLATAPQGTEGHTAV